MSAVGRRTVARLGPGLEGGHRGVELLGGEPGEESDQREGDPLDPETDIGRVVVFLCGPDAGYLTGITIPIDGGAAHLATDRTGKVLMSAQYGGGSGLLQQGIRN